MCDKCECEEKCEMEGCDSCCEEKCGCGSDCGCEDGISAVDMMAGLAKPAMAELVMERVKSRLEKKYGAKLDQIADLLVASMENEMNMKKGEQKQEELKDQIEKILFGE